MKRNADIVKYSIIIPCYNEADNLDNLMERIRPLQEKYDLEYVFVENGSKDNSRAYFKEKVEGKYPDSKIVYVENNQGYGYGLQQGMKAAEGDYIGWIHADLQIPPEELVQFFDEVEQQPKSARLFLKSCKEVRSAYEQFFTNGLSVFSTLLFRIKLYDITGIPVLFSRSLIDKVPIDDMPNDFSIELYIYVKAAELGYHIIRPKVKLLPRKAGNSSWNRGLKSRIQLSRRFILDSIKIKKGEKVL